MITTLAHPSGVHDRKARRWGQPSFLGEPFAWWVRPAANGVRPAGFTPYMPWRTVPAEPLVPRSMPLVADRELVFLGVHLGDPLRPLEQLRAV